MQAHESSKAKRAPVRAKKARVTLPLDEEIIAWFRQQAHLHGGNYQTAINDALLEHIIREELHSAG